MTTEDARERERERLIKLQALWRTAPESVRAAFLASLGAENQAGALWSTSTTAEPPPCPTCHGTRAFVSPNGPGYPVVCQDCEGPW